MSSQALPPCGLYKTTEAIGSVPAGRLVYFHNHGDPGPGIYLPEGWSWNRARFSRRGVTLPDPALASTLRPLPAEGLYRVDEPFYCCAKRCRIFEADVLVQLGYNGEGRPILFLPEWTELGLSFPETGQATDEERLAHLKPLKVKASSSPEDEAASRTRH